LECTISERPISFLGAKEAGIPANLEAAKDYIVKNYGIRRDKIRTGDALTQINDVMVSLRDLNSVVWAGSCGGMPPQLKSVNVSGKKKVVHSLICKPERAAA
jgi:hypothetical protein